jgi:hypothetical protein
MRGLAVLFGGAIAAVLVAGIALSELMVDPKCTEGPCTQHVVRGAAMAVAVFIGLLWIVAAVAYEADRLRDPDADADRDADR